MIKFLIDKPISILWVSLKNRIMKISGLHITIIFLTTFCNATSQQLSKAVSAVKFQSSLQTGILMGQKGSSAALSINTINGVQYKTWFGGIGLGLDYYGLKRTVPLFVSIQKELHAKPSTWFWYADGGYDFPWLKDNQKLQYMATYKANGGLFYEAGGGYKFTVFNKTHLGLTAGYSFKQVKEKYTPPCNWCEWNTPVEQITTSDFRRITLKLNWWLQ